MPRKSYLQEVLTMRTGRDMGEYLRELYVQRRYTDQEIADLLGTNREAVTTLRKRLGVDRAERKAAIA